MQIELSDDLKAVLEKRAAARGMTVSSYANLIMQEQLHEDSSSAVRRAEAVDAFIEHMKTSTATSGRNGQDWREFIHEGHVS